MSYLVEAIRLLLPGFGLGFLIYSIVQGFAQPWYSLGLICSGLGAVLNLLMARKPTEKAVSSKVTRVLCVAMPVLALIFVIITILIKLIK